MMRAAWLAFLLAFAAPVCAQDGTMAEGPLDRALAATVAIADRLDEVAAGEIDDETADLRVAELRAAFAAELQAWRAMPPEARAAARASRAQAWTDAEARLATSLAGVAALPPPRYNAEGALLGPPSLADFVREPPVETFFGVYIQGFESSDFYPVEGGGPIWLDVSEQACAELNTQPRVGAGRGASLIVDARFEGFKESAGPYGYGHLGAYPARIYVERVLFARPLSVDEFEVRRRAALAAAEND